MATVLSSVAQVIPPSPYEGWMSVWGEPAAHSPSGQGPVGGTCPCW